jgi:cytochrome b561
MKKNTKNSYAGLTRLFHWTMGLVIIALLAVGFIMTNMADTNPLKGTAYFWHKSFGMVILALIPLRLLWWFINVEPTLPTDLPKWQSIGARLNIRFLYAIMILMPLSGFIMSNFGGHPINVFGLFTIPALFQKSPLASYAWFTHVNLAWLVAVAVILHIGAGLYHHFVRHDTVLKRMIFGK